VSGRVSQVGERYRFTIRALEVQTARVQGQNNWNMTAGKTLTALLRGSASGSGSGNYAAAGNRGSSGTSTSTTAGASGGTTQTPVQASRPTGPANGTYTLWPRPQATQAGLPAEIWIPQMIVTREFIVIFFAGGATGDFSNGRDRIYFSDWRYIDNIQLQDLDNPSRFYKPVSINYHSNGGGALYSMSFNRFPATRFKLSCNFYGEPPQVFEEITFGEPDQ